LLEVKMEGGSFGLQLGGQSTDVILLVMDQRGMDKLLSDKFTIGANAPAAPEPGLGVPPPPPPAEPSSRQGQILAALTAAGTQGLRPAEVRQATGIPQGTVASALHGLLKRGQVRNVHDRYVATGQERASEH